MLQYFLIAIGLADTDSLEQLPLPCTAQATGQISHSLRQNSLNCLKVLSAMAIYRQVTRIQISIGHTQSNLCNYGTVPSGAR